MSESFVKVASSLVFNKEISPLELRVLMALIFWGSLNKERPKHILYGAEKLGKQIGIGREACRKAIYKLAQFNLITINRRGNLVNESYGLSNDIELTIERGIEFLQNGGSADIGNLPLNNAGDLPLNEVGDLYLNEAGDLHLKTPSLPLNEAPLPLNEAGHIDDRFKIKYNLNKIGRAQAGAPARTRERTHNETPDIADVRTKPNGGRAAESLAKKEVVSSSVANDEVLTAIKSNFPDILADLSVSKAGNCYILRKKGKFALIEDIRLKEVAGWLNLKGFDARPMDCNTRVLGEILLS